MMLTLYASEQRLVFFRSVFVKIDCGYPRSGISSKRYDYIRDVLLALDRNASVTFKGLYAHCGNSYAGTTVEEVGRLRDQAIADLARLAEQLTKETGVLLLTHLDIP